MAATRRVSLKPVKPSATPAEALAAELKSAEARLKSLTERADLLKAKGPGFFAVVEAEEAAKKELLGLQERLAVVQAGLPDPAATKPAPAQPAAPALRAVSYQTKARERLGSESVVAPARDPWWDKIYAEIDLGKLGLESEAAVLAEMENWASLHAKGSGTAPVQLRQADFRAIAGAVGFLRARVSILESVASTQNARLETLEAASASQSVEPGADAGGTLERLEAAVAKLQNVRSMQYRGVWREAERYTPGDTATHNGSLWHCNASTTDRPGEGSEAWTLAAKRGRDGKDAYVAPTDGKPNARVFIRHDKGADE